MWGICYGCRRVHHARTCTRSASGKTPILNTQIFLGKWEITRSCSGAVVIELTNLKFYLLCENCVWCAMCRLNNYSCLWVTHIMYLIRLLAKYFD